MGMFDWLTKPTAGSTTQTAGTTLSPEAQNLFSSTIMPQINAAAQPIIVLQLQRRIICASQNIGEWRGVVGHGDDDPDGKENAQLYPQSSPRLATVLALSFKLVRSV